MQLGINKGNRCQICGGLLWGNVEHTGDFYCQGHPITQRTYSQQEAEEIFAGAWLGHEENEGGYDAQIKKFFKKKFNIEIK